MPVWNVRYGSRSDWHRTVQIETPGQLRSILERMPEEIDKTFSLIHPSGPQLVIRISGRLAVVEYWESSSKPPRLTASDDPRRKGYREFIIGGTPTPISKAICVSFETMTRVVEYYYEHGTLPAFVKWVMRVGQSYEEQPIPG